MKYGVQQTSVIRVWWNVSTRLINEGTSISKSPHRTITLMRAETRQTTDVPLLTLSLFTDNCHYHIIPDSFKLGSRAWQQVTLLAHTQLIIFNIHCRGWEEFKE